MAAALDNPEDIEKVINKKSDPPQKNKDEPPKPKSPEEEELNEGTRNIVKKAPTPSENPSLRASQAAISKDPKENSKETNKKEDKPAGEENKENEGEEVELDFDDDNDQKAKSIHKILYGGNFYKKVEN